MRYKTLFRVLLKVLGVWLVVEGLAALIGNAAHVVGWLDVRAMGGFPFSLGVLAGGLGGLVQLIAGLYLFFGGRWVIDKAIPGNRPYCHECGYDLSSPVGPQCPECGTPTSHTNVGS